MSSQKELLTNVLRDVEAYVRGYDVYLALKAVKYKVYSNIQSLPVPIHY